MCGIAGLIWREGDLCAGLDKMLDQVAHRGPDGQGTWSTTADPWRVALGHRRLSIIDRATGDQPMKIASGRYVITYNGEVYNFKELRRDLEARGAPFRTQSDTEVVLSYIAEHGPRGLADLNGMFGFAIWDDREKRLLLARDRSGIKPLYYGSLADGGIAFASELSAVLAPRARHYTVSPTGLASFLFSGYAHAPYTLIDGVHKLTPGTCVIWQQGRLSQPTTFWQLPATEETHRDEAALAEATWSLLGEAVERSLVADVPVGIFLSGGIDSSIVATLASQRRERMKAFSIGFRDGSYDESSYAQHVARGLRVELVQEQLDAGNLLEIADEALDKLDEPMADPSLLPTYWLSRLAARHVKVVVSGDGGDELWAGYPTYRAHRLAPLYRRMPGPVRQQVIARVVGLLPVSDRYQSLEWKLRRFTGRWDDDLLRRHVRWMSAVDLPELAKALPGAANIAPSTLSARFPAGADELNRLLALDYTTYLPGSVLAKVDRASMAHGLETRPVFLDSAVIDWAFRLPGRFKLKGQTHKVLLKRAARGRLPDVIVDRPKKGFAIPLAKWLRGPLAPRFHRVLKESPAWELGLLDRDVFATWFADHRERRVDHTQGLWCVYVLDRWLRKVGLPCDRGALPLPAQRHGPGSLMQQPSHADVAGPRCVVAAAEG